MNQLLKYSEYLNESLIDNTYVTDIKKHLLLFSDTIRKDWDVKGGKFTLFYDLYGDKDVFHGISLISKRRVSEIKKNYKNCRFTILYTTVYNDTDSEGRRNLSYDEVETILKNSNQYLFYDLVKGKRTENAAPDREHITEIIRSDSKPWYFILIRNKNCSLIKTKSRQESGKWAEHQLADIHGWEESSHDIRMKIDMNGESMRANGLIKTILKSEEDDIFTVIDDPATFVKYDLVIDNDKKIEVKKYGDKELWKGHSIPIMLAEQCKIADRRTLTRIVEWYNEIKSDDMESFDYIESLKLLDLEERKLSFQFSSENLEVPKICKNIKEHYNTRIVRLLDAFNSIDQDRWMHGIYGVYFASGRTNRINDFLIKIVDDGVRNIQYDWKIVGDWLGFRRLKLFMSVNGDAWEYILTEGNNFVRAFKLKDFEDYQGDRDSGILDIDVGVYVYDDIKHLWVKD